MKNLITKMEIFLKEGKLFPKETELICSDCGHKDKRSKFSKKLTKAYGVLKCPNCGSKNIKRIKL
jgi:predicted RNA-binding Zn-ribbon protein involved in translation (DUF1610 family)